MKLAFVHIPKTAGGSVKNWFRNYCPDTLVNPGHVLLKNFDQEYDKSFTIVRNTYHRLISAYVFAKKYGPKKYNKRLMKNNLQGLEEMQKTIDATNRGIVYWVNHLIETNNNTAYDLFTWTEGVDIILHQETLKEDFNIIKDITGVNTVIEKTRHVMIYDRNDYITTEYIKLIDKHYAKEIEYFNYKP